MSFSPLYGTSTMFPTQDGVPVLITESAFENCCCPNPLDYCSIYDEVNVHDRIPQIDQHDAHIEVLDGPCATRYEDENGDIIYTCNNGGSYTGYYPAVSSVHYDWYAITDCKLLSDWDYDQMQISIKCDTVLVGWTVAITVGPGTMAVLRSGDSAGSWVHAPFIYLNELGYFTGAILVPMGYNDSSGVFVQTCTWRLTLGEA